MFGTILAVTVAVGLIVGAIFAATKSATSASSLSARPGRKVIVRTVKGDRAAQRKIEEMLAKGYRLEGQASRKVAWSPLTGVFTRKQKHTLTFVKPS